AHEDRKTVEWLHRLLSTYWVPWKPRRRIFMDQESLPAGGGLSERLKAALRESRFLIVCCSKHSTRSSWVSVEVDEFLKSNVQEKVMCCLTGHKEEGPFAVPLAIRSIEQELKDQLFKPDLRGNPEKLRGRESKSVTTKEALALLAPLVDSQNKEALLDRR